MAGENEPQDPIKALMAEIEAEEAKDAEAQEAAAQAAGEEGDAATGEEDAEEGEASTEEEGVKEAAAGADGAAADKSGAGDPPNKPDKSKKLVPASRLDEETAKRRIAERRAAEAQAELERERKRSQAAPAKDGDEDADPAVKTPEQIKAEAKAELRREMEVEAWLDAGHTEYGQEEFDARSNDLAKLNPPEYFLPVLFEAMDTKKQAARAVYLLAEQDPTEVSRVLKLSPIKLATFLQKLVAARRPAEREEDAAPKPKPKAAKPAPKPITPVGTGHQVNGFNIGDEVSDEEFGRNFDKMMAARTPH